MNENAALERTRTADLNIASGRSKSTTPTIRLKLQRQARITAEVPTETIARKRDTDVALQDALAYPTVPHG